MEFQAITIKSDVDLSQLTVEDLRQSTVDIRKAIETPLWQAIDFHERQAQRELDDLNRGAVIPSVEEVQRIHRELIEKCDPIFGAITRLYGLQSAVFLTASTNNVR